jgi:hypothetical protein
VGAAFGNLSTIHLFSGDDSWWPFIGVGTAARPVRNGDPEVADFLLRLLKRTC